MGGSGFVEDIHGGAGFCIATYLGLVLPVAHIKSLQEVAKFGKHGRLPNPGNVVFDSLR